ncbi:hypothetical protein AB6A40_010273 [Gnathostoma spinigerum]|uniref:DEP domain-containing protein n=1 Tax=Gnathostoma spinigerum TaxID=75299 RepID=A0ABD6EUB4_9BILA
MSEAVRLKGYRGPLLTLNDNFSGDASCSSKKRADSEENLFEGQFKATKIWNGILNRFHDTMPLKRHRRQFKTYEACFTGKEAVDFLLEELPSFISGGREITR